MIENSKLMTLKINGLTKSEIEQLRTEYMLFSLQSAAGNLTRANSLRKDYLFFTLFQIRNHSDYPKMFTDNELFYL